VSVVRKSEVPPPVLPKETVEVPSLGGEVVVRGLRLVERLALQSEMAKAGDPSAIGVDEIMRRVPALLAMAVIDADGAAIFTAAEWEDFGATHQDDAVRLFNVAMRLAGYGSEEIAKN
jgi:hypothetical protein